MLTKGMVHDWKGLIIGSVVSTIIFLLIYSLWFNPTIVTSTFDRIKSSVGTNIQSSVEKDPSVNECLSQINRKLTIMKEKSPIKVNLYVKEYKKFTTKNEAENYLNEWGFSTVSLFGGGDFLGIYTGASPADWMDYAKIDIIIALVRQEVSVQGVSGQQLTPFLCVDGEFKTKARCPSGAMSYVQLQKNVPLGRYFDRSKYTNFSYTPKSEENYILNYSLILKDKNGDIVDSDFGDNHSGGTISVDITKIEENEFETIFTLSTLCGTYKE